MTKNYLPSREKIESFESLRGLMAIWVLIGHVTLTFSVPALENIILWEMIGQNGKAVYVFMILSGFVIFFLLYSKTEGYLIYIFRRFLRIFPAYLVCLVISALLLPTSLDAAIAFASESARNASRVGYLSSSLENFSTHFLIHLTMLHGLIPSQLLSHTDWAILGQAWSISVEWQFYLLAPLFLMTIKQKSRLRGLFFLLLMLVPLYLLSRKLGDGFIGRYLLYFAIGCASAVYWFNIPNWNSWITHNPNFSIPLLTLLSYILMPDRWEICIWVAVFLSALSTQNGCKNISVATVIASILHWSPLRYLGKISYSLYLVHMIPLFATLWFLRGSPLPTMTLLAITMSSTLFFSLILSACIYRWVELPFINFGKTITSRIRLFSTSGD